MECESLWMRMIKNEFSMDGLNWFTRSNSRTCGSGLWEKIYMGREKSMKSIKWKFGSTNRVRLWDVE